MSNVMRLILTFLALVVIVGGIVIVVANYTGNQDILPPFLQETQEQVE